MAGVKASEVENGVRRGEEFRRFWIEVCGVGEDDGEAFGEGRRGTSVGGELGRNPRERLRVVGFDGRCESPVLV